jgi:hypothetical protein
MSLQTRLRLPALLALALLAGCTDGRTPVEPRDGPGAPPALAIEDGAHTGGTPGFYFLPPIADQPNATGAFDATVEPRVVICEIHAGACTTTIATYSRTTGPGGETIALASDHYQVLWRTDGFALSDLINYRIEAYLGTTRVGFADVDVARNASEFKSLATDDIIPLVNGRTLPIKFRIEQGIVLLQPELLVAQPGTFGNIVVVATTATGDVPPLRTIAGVNTGLSYAVQLTRDDATGLLYVSNSGGSVTVYSQSAMGDVAPLRNIQGPSTGLTVPSGVALDPVSGELYVVDNPSPFRVVVFAPGADGDASPVRTISGPSTGMVYPVGLLRDPSSGELYVASNGNSTITVYASGATGDVAPVRTIGGPHTGLAGPADLAFDSQGQLYVTNLSSSSVTVYAPGANGDAAPVRVIAGANTGLSAPFGILLDPGSGELFVANNANGTVTVYPGNAAGDAPPLRTIGGASTGMPTPAGLSF